MVTNYGWNINQDGYLVDVVGTVISPYEYHEKYLGLYDDKSEIS